MCWDFFMDSYNRRTQLADGLCRLQAFAREADWRMDWDLNRLLLAEQRIALVTDTAQVIRFATPNLEDMNGYRPNEVIGQQPKIFQGKDTCPETRQRIREAVVRCLPFSGSLLNYRKDGTPYTCLVEEYPVWNRSGALVHFIAFEKIA